MKILLLGANGQLGQELHHTLPSVGAVKACGRAEVDFTEPQSIIAAIDTFQPDLIVNAAAYTAVDKAESERTLSFQVNADAVGTLAHEAAKRNIWLIHYSTDYVFDGSKTEPYSETDIPNPINVYGESKLAGERAIAAKGCKHFVFRVAWLLGSNGQSFAKTILRRAMERDSLKVINDQYGAPTAPMLIAKTTATAIASVATSCAWPTGIYHLSPHGKTTWFGIAQTLLQLAKEQRLRITVDDHALLPVTSSEYPTPASRPKNSLFNTRKLQQQLDIGLPHWQDGFVATATKIIQELKSA
ncbi:MAG: dTDP-4-dehydrorhamnose reductase [Candidatus Eutrophobiaceae bacterium]